MGRDWAAEAVVGRVKPSPLPCLPSARMTSVLSHAHRLSLLLRGKEFLQGQMATGMDDQGQEEEAVNDEGWTEGETLWEMYHGGPA